MKHASLKSIADMMKNLDYCMMITHDGRGSMHARPMSNNGKVEYDGNSWFFTYKGSHKVKQIDGDAKVSLIFQTKDMVFIECYGRATITDDKSLLEEKWVDELNMWFPQGIETPGICLLKVTANRVHYWNKEDEGEYKS